MITSADAVLMLFQPILFPTPEQIQQFAADDIYDTDAVKPTEAVIGVDGVATFGMVFNLIMQNYALQADSPSVSFFETIFLQQRAGKTVYPVSGNISLPSLGKKYTMTNGGLTGYKPAPDAKRLLQPMKFQVTWQSVVPAPL
jgi:hypothetical protein